jgi:hypothetical protein
MARVPARRGGLRAARFLLPLVVAGPGQRRRERQRYPAGCRHFQRGLRPRQWAGGSSDPGSFHTNAFEPGFLVAAVYDATAVRPDVFYAGAFYLGAVHAGNLYIGAIHAVGFHIGADHHVGFYVGADHHVGYYVDADHHASNYIGADHAVRFYVGVNHPVGSYAGVDHVGLYIGAVHRYQPRNREWAGMNRVPARLCVVVVVVLCVRVTRTLAENDVAGAPLQGSEKTASRTGQGYRTVRTRIQPL